MTPAEIIRNVVLWFLYVVLHVFVVRHFVLLNHAFCFIYIGAILFLDTDISSLWLLFIAFGTGLIIDSFSNTLGMHTAALTLTGYLKPLLTQAQLAQKNPDTRISISLYNLGIANFLAFVLPIVSVHTTLLLFIDAGTLAQLPTTLLKIGVSILFTVFGLIILQLFSRNS